MIQLLRNAAEQVIQKPHSQTGSKARDNGPPEPAGDPAQPGGGGCAELCQVAAHQAGHKAGAVRNAVSDERSQHGVHHPERSVADVRHHGGDVAAAKKVLQQQGKRQHHAARHNKRQHVGDAAHQVAVVFAAQLLPVAGAEGVPAAVDGSLAGNGLFQQSVRVAHGIPRRGIDQPLANEPRQRDRAIHRHDHALCGLDLIIGQLVVDTGSAVRLDLERQAAGLRGLLERLRRQIGVRDAGGAGRHGQQLIAGLGGTRRCVRRGRRRLLRVLLLPRGDGAAECLGGLTLPQAGAEIGVQKERRQLGQHLYVQVVGFGGGGDHHQQVQRLAVRCVAGQRRVQRQRSQLQLPDGGAFGVRDGQAVAHTDAAQRQPGADVRRKHSGVSQIVSPVQQCNHLLHCTGERVCPLAQCDAVRPQVVGDAHGLSLRLVPLCSGSCRCSADFAAQY